MEISFSDYINDSVRILILLNAIKDQKTYKISEHRIKLYDYFLKFPCTMLGDTLSDSFRWNFDEYYAFFHWHPDLVRYRQSLAFLQSKALIERSFENNSIEYKITELGIGALTNITCPYKERLSSLADEFIPTIAKLSNTKIEQMIDSKSKKGFKSGGQSL